MGPLAIAQAGLKIVGDVFQGGSQYQQDRRDSTTAQQNAGIERQNAADIRLAGQAAEQAKRREVRQTLGRSAAAASQSGTGGVATGTNNALLKQSSIEGELDALNVRYDAQSEARGHDIQALNYDEESRAARRRARGAKWATFFNVASDALGGSANYSNAMTAKRVRGAQRSAMTYPASSVRGPIY